MSNVDKLISLGAECVGGDLVWKHKLLGRIRNGDLQLTEEGVKTLEIEDVVVKEDKPKRGLKKSTPVADEAIEVDVE